jgi:hypothetical protein
MRLFRHLLSGGNPEAVDLYCWHIDERSGHRMREGIPTDVNKISVLDYQHAAIRLFDSMRYEGFDQAHPIPTDPTGELLNGSHRLACALALGIEAVPVECHERAVWAPAWDAAWFREHGMDDATISDLERELYQ